MANTLSTIKLTGVWQSVTSLTGIAIGVGIVAQNQGATELQVAISATQPLDNFEGVVIPPNTAYPANIPSGESEIWIKAEKGVGYVNIQEV